MAARGISDSLKECLKLTEWLINHKDSAPFREKVDWEAWKLYDYPNVIKEPMDLGTVTQKINGGKYQNALEYAQDVRLVWNNCKTYNQDGSDYYKLATTFSKIFEQRFAKIDLSADLGEIKPPSVEDKMKFSENLYKIESEALGNVVTMLDERCTACVDKTDPDEIEINIDAIDALTFQAVNKFVSECLNGKENSRNKKRKRS